MINLSWMMTENSLSVIFLDTGNAHSIDRTHENWDAIVEKLKSEDYTGLEDLISVKGKIASYVSDSQNVEVVDDGVKYKGRYIDNYLTQKILSFMKNDYPVKPLLNFFEKVMKNPSKRSVDQLYKFLEHGNMPLTPDGNFLGYKAVREDWKDYYSGRYDNSPGKSVQMERNEVCDDPNLGCSRGLHVGTISYARDYGKPGGRIIIVEVDPSNCVSVPHDCNHEKLRTSEYFVVKEFERILETDYDEEYSSEDDNSEERSTELQIEIDSLRQDLSDPELLIDEVQSIIDEIRQLEDELNSL